MSKISSHAEYLTRTRIPLRLSCRTGSGWPFVLSLWYLYRDGLLYCATQADARVVSYLENEPRCAYEIAGDLPPYCGIRGQAKARIDPESGGEILESLLVRYLGGTDSDLAKGLLENVESEIALVLEPINCFRWDFTQRMQTVAPDMLELVEKSCPG